MRPCAQAQPGSGIFFFSPQGRGGGTGATATRHVAFGGPTGEVAGAVRAIRPRGQGHVARTKVLAPGVAADAAVR